MITFLISGNYYNFYYYTVHTDMFLLVVKPFINFEYVITPSWILGFGYASIYIKIKMITFAILTMALQLLINNCRDEYR